MLKANWIIYSKSLKKTCKVEIKTESAIVIIIAINKHKGKKASPTG